MVMKSPALVGLAATGGGDGIRAGRRVTGGGVFERAEGRRGQRGQWASDPLLTLADVRTGARGWWELRTGHQHEVMGGDGDLERCAKRHLALSGSSRGRRVVLGVEPQCPCPAALASCSL